jgi:hypothetical protein|tara:strand:- start:399 stop:641 length:243 start_codon:yes stop_codon:yes gene_type:complete
MAERHVLWTELDRQLNELAHNIGMERQHKKLIRQLLVNTAQAFYHDGYEDGFEDNKARAITAVRSVMRDEIHPLDKENSE